MEVRRLLMVFWCDIPENKDRSSMKHGVVVRRPCFRNMVTGEVIISLEMVGEKSVRDIEMMRSTFLEISQNIKRRVMMEMK